MNQFSWQRFAAIIYKEFIQMRRDRLTFAMMIAVPLMQLILFGFAINTNAEHLPTAIVAKDNSIYINALVKNLETTRYFKVNYFPTSDEEANALMRAGKVLFVITFNPNFSRDLIKGLKPPLLVEADGTDPTAVSYALATIPKVIDDTFKHYLRGAVADTNNKEFNETVKLIFHTLYNPEKITQYNIVPGLLGVVLTMTMIIITSLAITRERERGTMEGLLATPVGPWEVMLGKIIPYIVVGYIQMSLVLFFALVIFQVPMHGSFILLYAAALPFIAANLAVGLTFSSLAQNQLQSMQMGFFFFLPSMILSGFLFPFSGMPMWAQIVGNFLPLTHFLRIIRGIMLKGNGLTLIAPELLPIVLFFIIMICLGIKKYRRTLD